MHKDLLLAHTCPAGSEWSSLTFTSSLSRKLPPFDLLGRVLNTHNQMSEYNRRRGHIAGGANYF